MELTKTFRVMKLTVLLLTVGIVHVSAKGTSQTVSFSGKDVPLATVFQEVKRQTGYVFFYDESDLSRATNVTLRANRQPLLEFLEQVFTHQPLQYSIQGKAIYVSVPAPPNEAPHVSLTAPPIDVHGTIKDENGNPLEGISVKIKGTNRGTTTNAYGQFTLTGVNGNEVLIFTGTNIESFEKKLNGEKEFSLTAKMQIKDLQEVVVNKGYYTTQQKFNTGSVSVVKGDALRNQPINDPILGLEGRVPGMFIQQSSGVPGSVLSVQLRGKNSIAAGNNPLFIIDGVPFTNTSLTSPSVGGGAAFISPFASLDPSTIESIEVLKDADATAIYGSRGANGVILITTKGGKTNRSNCDVNVYAGNGRVQRPIELLNTPDYLKMRHEALSNDALTSIPRRNYDIDGTWDSTRYTDWQKVLISGKSQILKAELSFSGGNANTQFFVGGSYAKQTTVYPGNYYDKTGSGFFSLNHTSVNQKFKITASSAYVNQNNKMPTADLTNNITLAPNAPALYTADGSINWAQNAAGTYTFINPIAKTLTKAVAITENLVTRTNMSYELVKGLQLQTSLGYNTMTMDQTMQVPLVAYNPANAGNTSLRENVFGTTRIKTWIIEPQVNYRKKIGAGEIQSLVGLTFQENSQNSLFQYASDFPSDDLISNIALASNITTVDFTKTNYRYNAFFGRLGYSYLDRYLINLTARRDGSSRFGAGYQFGNFGAIGLGWVFSNESYFKDKLSFLSYGKIRSSIGISGNDQIKDYQYLSSYTAYNYPYDGISGLYPTRISNPYYRWEEVRKFELGLEIGLANDHIFLNTNYYNNKTNNSLVGYSLPNFTGFSSVTANLPATIQNTGVEIDIRSTIIKSKRITWESSANITFPRNKLLSYPNLEGSSYANSYIIGESLFKSKQYHFLGVDKQTGLYTFQDVNKDGVLSYPEDLIPGKAATQNFFGGFQNAISYRGWQLEIFFQFVKQDGYLQSFSLPGIVNQNQPTSVLKRWRVPGDDVTVQKFSTNYGTDAGQAYGNLFAYSDGGIGNRSFIRLKNAVVSYQIPVKWKDKLKVRFIKLYCQGQNLWTITPYKGLDPETGGLSLPPLQVITGGVKIGF